MNRYPKCRIPDLIRRPFYDEEPMVGPPACSEEDFKLPLLRRCPFDWSTVTWTARLDGGLDGFAWQVRFGDQGPFVLKFWDTEPPTKYGFYYAAQRESQNAAILEKIGYALDQDSETLPIRVHAEPRTYDDAMDNMLAFSTEGRERQLVRDADAVEISSIPRMKKCFGWVKIQGKQLYDLDRRVRAPVVKLPKHERQIWPDRQYFAIVYEYIPEGDNDRGQMQLVLDFLWRAGFLFSQSLRKENWKSGVLVDLSDMISPIGHVWQKGGYRRTDASRAFLPPPPPPAHRYLSHPQGDSDSPEPSFPSPTSSPSSSSSCDTEDSDPVLRLGGTPARCPNLPPVVAREKCELSS